MPMNNDERDKLLIEIHADMRVTSSTVKELAKDVWGNGKPGIKEDTAIMKKNYQDCPARKANSTESKRLSLAMLAVIIAAISTLASIVFGVMK